MAVITVLNGPNLNLLGIREPAVYGSATLDDIRIQLEQLAKDAGHELRFFQSNAEHEIVDQIHEAFRHAVRFIVINPAAFTHTSIALRDALLATGIPFIEVHLSNVYARESFRRISYLSDIAAGVICGLGTLGYELALRAAFRKLAEIPE
ncbi:MAG: type II 3-dehydroquinate dehydratase [Gammaproteobacteria bacterium]